MPLIWVALGMLALVVVVALIAKAIDKTTEHDA
jgi:uncharacterized membrane protein